MKDLEVKYIFDEKGNIKPNMHKKEYLDNSLYIGEISVNELNQEIRQGTGIYYYNNSQNHLLELGKQKYINDIYSEIYAGTWKNNVFEGYGIYLFSTGERYEGFL